jgi:hypothetical protein
MSRNMQRIMLLILTGVGLGGFAIYQIIAGAGSDHVAIGIAYLLASIVAFGAVIRLPTKAAE